MLVAIEYGGQWRMNLAPSPGVDLVMVVQVVDEDPLVFARRFLAKVLGLVAQGSDVIFAVLAVAPTFDVRQLKARCAIARTLLRVFRPARRVSCNSSSRATRRPTAARTCSQSPKG